MKKAKLKLEDLKVKSFITSMEGKQKQTIDGGATTAVTSPVAGLTPISASVVISTLVNSILDATKTDNVGTQNTNVVCESDMCFTAYGWWCNIV